jgi:hypothetical protein
MEPKYYLVSLTAEEDPRLSEQPYLSATILVELTEKVLESLEALNPDEQALHETHIAFDRALLLMTHEFPDLPSYTQTRNEWIAKPPIVLERVTPTILDDSTRTWLLSFSRLRPRIQT